MIVLCVVCGIVGKSSIYFPDLVRYSLRLSRLGVALVWVVLDKIVTRRRGRKADYHNLEDRGGQETFDHEMGRTGKDSYSSDVSVLAL